MGESDSEKSVQECCGRAAPPCRQRPHVIEASDPHVHDFRLRERAKKHAFAPVLPLRFTDVRKRRAVLSSSSKMVWCVAIGCKNSSADRKKRGVSFHRFPKAKGLQKRWVAALKLKRLTERYAETGYVCSEHFVESDFKRDLRAELMGTPLRRTLVEEAVPSVFSFKKVSRRKPPSASREHSRVSTCMFRFSDCLRTFMASKPRKASRLRFFRPYFFGRY